MKESDVGLNAEDVEAGVIRRLHTEGSGKLEIPTKKQFSAGNMQRRT